jgi:hypothetical protein
VRQISFVVNLDKEFDRSFQCCVRSSTSAVYSLDGARLRSLFYCIGLLSPTLARNFESVKA